MRRLSVALSTVGVSLALAACVGDRDSTGPRSIAPGSTISGVVLPASCDPNNISQSAKKYFKNGDDVYALISTMKDKLKTSTTEATPTGFSVLAQTALVRRTAKQIGTNLQGATFVNAVLGCMDVGTLPTSFNAAQALGAGIFEVRTSGSTEGPTVAYSALTAGSTAAASPEFGAEAASPTATPVWPSVSGINGNRYLVYGYPFGSDVLASGFELGSVPAPNAVTGPSVNIAGNPLAIGICSSSSVTLPSGKKAANLLVHNGTTLNLQKLNFCNTDFTVTSSATWLHSLPTRLLALVKPTTLFAQDETRDFIGGLPSGWSPNTVQQFISSNITLSFFTQPIGTKLSGPLVHVVVEAVTTEATMPPTNVRLTIANNSGTPAFLTTSLGGTAQSYVDATLVAQTIDNVVRYFATYDIGFTKAGGYTLNATGYIGGGGVATPTKVSDLFNVKNQ